MYQYKTPVVTLIKGFQLFLFILKERRRKQFGTLEWSVLLSADERRTSIHYIEQISVITRERGDCDVSFSIFETVVMPVRKEAVSWRPHVLLSHK